MLNLPSSTLGFLGVTDRKLLLNKYEVNARKAKLTNV